MSRVNIPGAVVEKLICSICDGYLNCRPVFIRRNNDQVCAKCFKLLADDQKSDCIENYGLEAVAEFMIFPCRYNDNGCSFTFLWNQENGHEDACPFRYPTNQSNKQYLKQEKSYSEPYSEMEVNQRDYDRIYETIPERFQCTNCTEILTDSYNYCLFGHKTCFNCKGDMCILCLRQMNNEMKKTCRNINKGCRELVSVTEIARHQDNCPFNDIQCPFKCQFCDQKDILIEHLTQDHAECVLKGNEFKKIFTEKDDMFIIICYKNLFKVTYYNFMEEVEFCVTLVGSAKEAEKYQCQFTIESNKDKSMKKRIECSNWNTFALDKGAVFKRQHLQRARGRLCYEAQIKLIYKPRTLSVVSRRLL